jgi:hypothetical protein
MADAIIQERGPSRISDYGLLFESTLKVLLLASFLELVLYRLVSRLGMHLSKLAAQHDWIRVLFKGLSSIGFTLLNVVSLLVFLALVVALIPRVSDMGRRSHETVLVVTVSLLLVLTVAFLIVPPTMVGAMLYNAVTSVVLITLAVRYLQAHDRWSERAMMIAFLLGVFGWLYYQTISTAYGYWEVLAAPPLAHEVNRFGEAMMVLASMLVFWAYGGLQIQTTNKRQRRRVVVTAVSAGTIFVILLFLDYALSLYDKGVAENVRKAGEGIGWIFQMGMGYTFYLPFAFYVAGLFCWSYTVVKQVAMGRPAGYGLGLMFMAGYALQLSHLTLMVVLGLILLNMDRRRTVLSAGDRVEARAFVGTTGPIVGERI